MTENDHERDRSGTPFGLPLEELRPDDRGHDEVREALEEGIGKGESRPLTREERAAAAHDTGPANTVYAPASERVAKPPLPGDEKLINHADLVAPDDHVQGPVDARVTLVLYGDYECPYTRMSRHSVRELQLEYPDSLRFAFRHFPLEEIHPHARAASAAAEAADAQGQFWAMHEYLFEHQDALEDADLQRYAIELGLDAARFDRDRTSSATASRIDRDLASGEQRGVPGTPTFFVNGVRHHGSYDVKSLRASITAQLAQSTESAPR